MEKINETKKSTCTTLPVRDRALFYILCYKEFGYGKYSIQSGMLEAIRDFNSKKLSQMTENRRDALFDEVKDFLKADMKERGK